MIELLCNLNNILNNCQLSHGKLILYLDIYLPLVKVNIESFSYSTIIIKVLFRRTILLAHLSCKMKIVSNSWSPYISKPYLLCEVWSIEIRFQRNLSSLRFQRPIQCKGKKRKLNGRQNLINSYPHIDFRDQKTSEVRSSFGRTSVLALLNNARSAVSARELVIIKRWTRKKKRLTDKIKVDE